MIPWTLHENSVVFGIAFSIFLPLVSNIMPIKQVLGSNLRESLDVHRVNLSE